MKRSTTCSNSPVLASFGAFVGRVVAIAFLGLAGADRNSYAQDSAAGNQPTNQFERVIHFSPITDQEIVRVPFDAALYGKASTDLHDVRILDGAGEEIPFLLRRQMETHSRIEQTTWTVSNPQLQPDTKEGLVVQFSLDKKDPSPKGLRLVTPLTDFEQTLKLFAVEDSAEILLVDSEVIFDYSKYMNVRRTEISIPDTSARSFRLVISSPTADQKSTFLELTQELQADTEVSRREEITIERRPFRIDRVELFADVEEQTKSFPVLVEYPISIKEVRQVAERKETVLLVSTGSVPLQRLELDTPSKNFSRRVSVMSQATDGKFSQEVGSAQLSRVAFREIKQSQLAIPLSMVGRHTELEVVIENRDSPVLEVSRVRGFGYVEEAAFFALPGQAYRLVCAPYRTTRPDYDVAALDAVLTNTTTGAVATLGPVVEKTVDVVASPRRWIDLVNQPWVIGSVVVVLVVILGGGLYHASKQIDNNIDTPSK